jgi:hypothetical protein
MIEIEKGIAIPRDSRNAKYPFGSMEVSDSIFLPNTTSATVSSITSYYRQRGMRFTCRALTEYGVKGVRVWRIE